MWGDVLVWGSSNFVDSAEECCNQCKNYTPKKAEDLDCNGECCLKIRFVYDCHISHRTDMPHLHLQFITALHPAVWVYCGDQDKCAGVYKQCWLKHLAHPEASKPKKEGPHVPWTAGTIDVDLKLNPADAKKDKKKV